MGGGYPNKWFPCARLAPPGALRLGFGNSMTTIPFAVGVQTELSPWVIQDQEHTPASPLADIPTGNR